MATWATFEEAAPDQAALAAQLWSDPFPSRSTTPSFPIAYLATVRPDGAPRLHPFCPVRAGGRLFAVIPRSSPKGNDLRRDGRCVVHALPGPDDAELCIRARAIERTDDAAVRGALVAVVEATGVGGMIETTTHDPIFELDIEQVDTAYWVDVGQPGTHAVRQRWQAT